MSINYNQFKSTTVYGNFVNASKIDNSNNLVANATFYGDIILDISSNIKDMSGNLIYQKLSDVNENYVTNETFDEYKNDVSNNYVNNTAFDDYKNDISNNYVNNTNLSDTLLSYAPLNSPNFIGSSTCVAPPSGNNNTTRIVNSSWVQTNFGNLNNNNVWTAINYMSKIALGKSSGYNSTYIVDISGNINADKIFIGNVDITTLYVTISNFTNTLMDYVTNNSLQVTLLDYMKKSDISNNDYVDTTSLMNTLSSYAPLFSPQLSGFPTCVSPSVLTNNTRIANCQYVNTFYGALTNGNIWTNTNYFNNGIAIGKSTGYNNIYIADISGNINATKLFYNGVDINTIYINNSSLASTLINYVTNSSLSSTLTNYAQLNSPNFTGQPSTTTPSSGNNITTRIANCQWTNLYFGNIANANVWTNTNYFNNGIAINKSSIGSSYAVDISGILNCNNVFINGNNINSIYNQKPITYVSTLNYVFNSNVSIITNSVIIFYNTSGNVSLTLPEPALNFGIIFYVVNVSNFNVTISSVTGSIVGNTTLNQNNSYTLIAITKNDGPCWFVK